MTTTDWYSSSPSDYSGGNQCILNLSWYIPSWIQAADLIEDYPGWTAQDKRSFQAWLADVVYKRVAWSSRVRRNNWGGSGSSCAMVVADYLWDSNLTLHEVKPAAVDLTPAQAFAQHRQMQLDRMNTIWQSSDSVCSRWGIQPDGAYPDELRRGSSGCDAQWIVAQDASWSYTQLILQFFTASGELLLRRGDPAIFDNVMPSGAGSLLHAIHFVIQNDAGHSTDWSNSHKSTLEVAYRYYRDPAMWAQLNGGGTRYIGADGSRFVNFGTLTHGFSPSENPGLPPTVPPPGSISPPDKLSPLPPQSLKIRSGP